MFRFFLLLFIVSMGFTMQAQNLSNPKGCGHDHYVHLLNQTYPGFKQAADQTFQDNKTQISFRDDDIYTIPVVVHIVWQEEDQNLPEAQINQVIESLNKDYRRLNTDANLVRGEFADVVGDPGIQFELAGIERVQTDATFQLDLLGGGVPDNVKVSAEGGSDAWDTEQYLNIWICNIEGGSLLGYAYPPMGLEHWPEGANAPSPNLDGVVIHYEVFKTTGTYTASGLLGLDEITIPVRGRTITHEVGHYLGLRHVWGDGLLSILGIPDCDADDGIEDTPQQGLNSQFQCDPELNTCGDGADDLPDMFENFMDYASEDCMNSFTLQQIAIMRSVLENERSGIVSTVTDTEDEALEATAFTVYPNPTKEQITINASLLSTTDLTFTLVDMNGRTLKTISAQKGSNQQVIGLSDLPAGLYGLLITDNKQQQYFKRIVVQ